MIVNLKIAYCLIGLSFVFPSQALPVWALSNVRWAEDLSVFSTQCGFFLKPSTRAERPIDPKQPFVALLSVFRPQSKIYAPLKGYLAFESQSEARPTQIFGVYEAGEESVLGRLHPQSGLEQARFTLPFRITTASLVSADIVEGERWKTVLCLIAQNKALARSHVWMFEIKNEETVLVPFKDYELSGAEILSTEASILRQPEGRFVLMFGAEKEGRGTLRFIPLDRPEEASSVRMETVPRFLMPVDLAQKGVFDRLYAADETALLKWDQNPSYTGPITVDRLAEISLLAKPQVVPHPWEEGVRVYCIGKVQGKSGLYLLEDKKEGHSLALVKEGQYCDLFIRFGQLILVPLDAQQMPEVLRLPDHQLSAVPWEAKHASPTKTQSHRVLSKILWDPLSEEEFLLSLDSNCQKTILSAPLNRTEYARTAWRREIPRF